MARVPHASILLWLALVVLRLQIASDAGMDLGTALSRGIALGWLDDAVVALGAALAARLAWLILRIPPRASWPLFAAFTWAATLANVLHHRFFEALLELWVVRFHWSDMALVAGAAMDLGVSWWIGLSAALIIAAIVLCLAGRTAEASRGRAPAGGRLRSAALVAAAGLLLLLGREGVLRVVQLETVAVPVREQIFKVWAKQFRASADPRLGRWDERRGAKRGRLRAAIADPLSETGRAQLFDTLAEFRDLGRGGPVPLGLPAPSPSRKTPAPPGGPLHRALEPNPADVWALREALGLDPERAVNVAAVFVESFRALELQHPEIGPGVFPRLRALLEDHGIWFTQAYSSAFTAGQTVRGQFSAKCSALPNFRGVAAYVGHTLIRATCLPELFRRGGADTLWMHTLDGEDHNSARFEKAHGTRRVLDYRYFHDSGITERIGDWGLADAPFLQKSLDVLEQTAAQGNSFFATLLTVSSHSPFEVPDNFTLPQNLLKLSMSNGKYQRLLKSFHYVDGALADFLERLFASDLGGNTLVVLVGDHSVRVVTTFEQSPVQQVEMRFRVPLALLTRDMSSPGKVTYPVHQLDIAPTVARIAGLTGDVAWVGRDALSGSGSPWVYEEGDQFHFRIDGRACYSLPGLGESRCYEIDPDQDPLFAPALREIEQPEADVRFFRNVASAASDAVLLDLLEPSPGEGSLAERFRSLPADVRPGESSPQLWAHRGYHAAGAPENSLEALTAAVDLGFGGVELDIFFLPPAQLIVQHDPPTPEQLEHGALRTLEEYLAIKPRDTYLYLDFKNLDAANAAAAAAQLGPLLRRYEAVERTFVESTRWDALATLREHLPDVRTLYWITGYRKRDADSRRELRENTVRSGTGAVSINHRAIDGAFLRDFGHLRIHAFTVNHSERVRTLVDQGVDVILTDVDFSADFPELMAR